MIPKPRLPLETRTKIFVPQCDKDWSVCGIIILQLKSDGKGDYTEK